MKRSKSLFAFLLTILSIAFIIVLAFLQQQFNNPEFADLSNNEAESNAEKEKELISESGVDSSTDDEGKKNEEAEGDNISTSTRVVTVETLNVRAGPSTEYEIAGILVENESVLVEDTGDEWVEITTDEFTGYVNERYLSEE